MLAGNSYEQDEWRKNRFLRLFCFGGKVIALLALLGIWAGHIRGFSAEPSLNENQVKSIFLLNFAKYVVWPAQVFPTTNAPIVIGVIAETKFEAELAQVVGGKIVDGRPIVVHHFQKMEDLRQYHMVFIGAGEKKRLPELLALARTLPLLTVGETAQFLQSGGVINFTKKDGKVRLEIDLTCARQGQLQLSSKLLKVADLVRGK